jgi:LPS O-antigen subunit length determinant protein (WzzB/FepE family)
LERSKPKRTLMVLIWTFLGAVLSTGWVLVKDTVFQIKEEVTKA